MLHGWPGSIKEFYGVIPLLTAMRDDYDFVFELIIPSLPGFGFSQVMKIFLLLKFSSILILTRMNIRIIQMNISRVKLWA